MYILIKLYSTDCPKYKVLKVKLKNKGIEFEEIRDTDLMISKGFTTVPVLEIDNKIYEFTEAIKWVDGKEINGGTEQ